MGPKSSLNRRSIGFYQKLENDDIFFLASGLAFNLLVCFIPFLLVILSILGFFLHSSQDILLTLQGYLEKMLPYASPRLTSNILNLVKDRKLVGLIGFLGLLWAATRLFGSIRTVLDKTLESTTPHGYLKANLYDLGMVFVTGLFFLVSIVLTSIFSLLKTFPERIGINLPGLFQFQWAAKLVGLGVGYFFSVLMFFILFRFMPSRRPSHRTAAVTALLIAGLWEIAKYLFRLYVDFINNFTAIYGSLGLLVVLFFWIYYSCLIFVIGGELIWLFQKRK
ncbi:MAG: YihY/virulence factor BrkB family protein [Deltaproteobacteria bacterium]|nr:YihY/virulence factor BrkB family protein [Deltaproteobacteria bacterium]